MCSKNKLVQPKEVDPETPKSDVPATSDNVRYVKLHVDNLRVLSRFTFTSIVYLSRDTTIHSPPIRTR